VLKAFQNLEPGDFPGFLKILRSPSSQRLQSRCTAFLNTMEAYHVTICINEHTSHHFSSISPILIPDSHHLHRICRYRSSRTLCRISTSLLLNILKVSTDEISTFLPACSENTRKGTFEFPLLFPGFPEAQVTQIMEHVEKLIMTRLHKWVFCHDSCDDEQKDLALQRRIR